MILNRVDAETQTYGSEPINGEAEAFLASRSACSLPAIPLWPGTQTRVT